MDQLLALDRALFVLLNGAAHPQWLNQVMLAATDVHTARPLLALIAIGLLVFRRRRGLVIVLGAAATITMSDQLAAHVLKPWIERPRPCNALPEVVLLVGCSGAYSFPSAHAANAFSTALYFSRFAPPALALPLFGIAALVSYSRIYVGVHYPLDLVGGAVLGLGCAALVLSVMSRLGHGPRRRSRRSGRIPVPRGPPAPVRSPPAVPDPVPAPGADVG